jgi:hypothetical protein
MRHRNDTQGQKTGKLNNLKDLGRMKTKGPNRLAKVRWITMVATCGAEAVHFSRAHVFFPGFKWGSCCSIFSFLCFVPLFVRLSFFCWKLHCLSFFDLRFLITPSLSIHLDKKHLYWVKHAHAVTFIKQQPVLKDPIICLSCHRKYHMIWTSSKRSHILKDHLLFVPKVTF